MSMHRCGEAVGFSSCRVKRPHRGRAVLSSENVENRVCKNLDNIVLVEMSAALQRVCSFVSILLLLLTEGREGENTIIRPLSF